MISTAMKIFLAALVVFYIFKMFGGKKNAPRSKVEKRINTEGLEIKDAEFSEWKDEK